MEASALRYSGGLGLHRSPLLRLQSDERLIALVRRGNAAAFEVLVSRYQSRLLAFCRHLLGSREDAEDVLQEVLTAAFNAMIADERPINVRPWLYRIARNRCLNHLRRAQAVGVDSMDVHLSDFGASTADKVHMAEEFRLLVGDIQGLPETQRTALVLREMDALSYEQIAEAMETTVPSVKSLLVRARLSLAEASEARLLSCEQVRIELAEVAEGLLAKTSAPVRRHLRSCKRCSSFQTELKRTSKALAALLPIGPLALIKQLALAHLGHSAAGGSSGAASTGAAVGSGAAAGGAFVGAGGGMVPLGLGALATKAAAGLAAAALVTAGAVEVQDTSHRPRHTPATASAASETHSAYAPVTARSTVIEHQAVAAIPTRVKVTHHTAATPATDQATKTPTTKADAQPAKDASTTAKASAATTKKDRHGTSTADKTTAPAGTTQTESVSTVLTSSGSSTATQAPGSANNQLTAPAASLPPSASDSTTSTYAPGASASEGTSGTGAPSTSSPGTTTGSGAPDGTSTTSTGTATPGPPASADPGTAGTQPAGASDPANPQPSTGTPAP